MYHSFFTRFFYSVIFVTAITISVGCRVDTDIEPADEPDYLSGYSLSELRIFCNSSRLFEQKVALLGGSYALIKAGDIVRNSWRDILKVDLYNYATSGYGFCTIPHSIQDEAFESAGKFDYYIIWASTNDLYYGHEVGNKYDYSYNDGYQITNTQCGGINKTIKIIMDANPKAKIYFISSLPFFQQEQGYDLNQEHNGSIGSFVKGQRECCEIYGISFLNMLDHDYFNVSNFSAYYESDNIHLNSKGYERIALDIILFLSKE